MVKGGIHVFSGIVQGERQRAGGEDTDKAPAELSVLEFIQCEKVTSMLMCVVGVLGNSPPLDLTVILQLAFRAQISFVLRKQKKI